MKKRTKTPSDIFTDRSANSPPIHHLTLIRNIAGVRKKKTVRYNTSSDIMYIIEMVWVYYLVTDPNQSPARWTAF